MKKIFKYVSPTLALLGLMLGSCQVDITEPKANGGSADFSRYIAVGNSLTAGYADDGLYLEGQQNSYPSLLAQQFKQVGGGEFVQPLFPAANANGSGYLRLNGFDAAGSPQIGRVAPAAVVGLGADAKTPLLVRYTGTDNQNLGVPGIRIADITTVGYGLNNPIGFNPYFERLLPAGSPTSYLSYVKERVTAVKPTFFTNWLGNNDVLGYATSGGTGSPLTDVAEFTAKYAALTDVLTAGGAKGLLATIPNVTNVPLFTTVPTAAVIARVGAAPVPASTVAALTAGLGLTPTQAATIRFGLFIQTTNPTPGGSPVVREATAADLLLLPASAVINTPSTTANPLPRGLGIAIVGLAPAQAAGLAGAAPPNPLANALVLDAAEVKNVQTRTAELNAVIANEANQKGLALFDANFFFDNVARSGLVINGVSNSAAFVTGNLFSLDGVHPTPRGYALVANEMIKTINYKYGAHIPGIDATAYRGVKFP